MPASPRPLSPHLQIYRPQITSVLSIIHRITGVVLTLGTMFLSWWLVAAAYGPRQFDNVQVFAGSWVGQLFLWSFAFSIFYHLGNGMRHLAWDFGWGFNMSQLRASGFAVLVFAVLGTTVTLIAAYSMGG